MKDLDFKEKYNEVMERLKNNDTIVLATSKKDVVSARSVWYVLYESSIYFFTAPAYAKIKQIEKNPNVALCLDNIQLKGTAFIKGHPLQKENEKITAYCIEKHSGISEYNMNRKNMVLVEVKIHRIEMWVKHGREYLDITEKKAYRIG